MKKLTYILLGTGIIFVLLTAGFYGRKFLIKQSTEIVESTIKKSEVKIVDGVPRLFVSGKEFDSGAVNVYYYPPQGENHGPAYGDEKWLANMKALIDQSVGNGAKLIMLNVWWSDLDKSTSRPKNIGDNLDYAPLDNVFAYAGQKGAYVIPIFTLFPFDPDWWLKENNFPPYNKNKTCDFCETDSAGNVYNNASMNSDIAQKDFGGFVSAVVGHYKNNPALAGWDIGVGATGEDGYGPNYIALKAKNINNLQKFNVQSGTYTDYSPFFEKKFKAWIAKKYSSDQKLQTAWSDNRVLLSGVSIPKPADMIQNGKVAQTMFPDPTDIFAIASIGADGNELLTAKGLDFYEFRNEMRRQDREYYSELIKKNDPSHILFLNGSSDDLFGQSSDFDGIAFSMFGATEKQAESQSYFHSTDIARRAVKAGKLVLISNEHTCDGAQLEKTGECETPDQLGFIEKLGEAVKCSGGIFSPTVSIYDKQYLSNRNNWIPPVWFSDKALAAAKNINAFEPTKNCACSLAGEMYSENNCSAGSQSGCEWLIKAYASLCGKQVDSLSGAAKNNSENVPQNSPSGQQGGGAGSPCGDGVCDNFEKTSGKCPQDCK